MVREHIFKILIVLFVGFELVLILSLKKRKYPWLEFWRSAGLLLVTFIVNAAFFWLYAGVFYKVWQHRIYTFQFCYTLWGGLLLFLCFEVYYYLSHLLSHRVRFFWAGHYIHHVSEEYMIVSGLRTNFIHVKVVLMITLFTYLGVDPRVFSFVVGLNLFLQSLLHTDAFSSWGPLDWIFNSPAQHRLHHARNGPSLGKNFSGIFIFFDRLCGTYSKEGSRELGIENFPKKINYFQFIFFEWIEIAKELCAEKGFKRKLIVLLGPPKDLPERQGAL